MQATVAVTRFPRAAVECSPSLLYTRIVVFSVLCNIMLIYMCNVHALSSTVSLRTCDLLLLRFRRAPSPQHSRPLERAVA